MIPLAQAQAAAVALGRPLDPVVTRLADAIGCVLAADVVTEGPIPGFANSAMDGFAVRAADTTGAPVSLRVTGSIAAGAGTAGIRVEPGTAVRIMTGAPLPPGADAIVMVERATTDDTDPVTVRVEVAVEAGLFVRAVGSDVAEGTLVAHVGEAITPSRAGLLAAAGCAAPLVHRRPRVGVLSTGNELIDPPAPLGPGQIRDANRPALLANVARDGATPVDLGAVADTDDALDAALAAAAERCDLVLTSGGVSMGDHDLVKARLTPYQVAIKPAKPLALGHVDDTPVIGLPGNPVSALVSYELFARPLIRRLAGYAADHLHRPVVASESLDELRRTPDGKLHLLRVVATHDDSGRLVVRDAGIQASHVLSAMALANALAFVPDGAGVAAGGTVGVMLLA